MKKIRHYFGKNKVKHRLGRFNDQWVVPRMLRLYFERKYILLNLDGAAKMAINRSYGSLTSQRYMTDRQLELPEPAKALPSVNAVALISRRNLKAMFLSGSMPNLDAMYREQQNPRALNDALSATQRMLATGKLQQSSAFGKFDDMRVLGTQWRHLLAAKWYYELGECYPQIAVTLWGIASHLIEKLPCDMQLRWQTDPRVQEMLANAEVAFENGTVGKLLPAVADDKADIVGIGRGLTTPGTWMREEDILTFGQMSWTPYPMYDLNHAPDEMIKHKIDEFLDEVAEQKEEAEITRHPLNLDAGYQSAILGTSTLSDWDNGPLFDKNGDAIPYTLTGPVSIISDTLAKAMVVPEHLQGGVVVPSFKMESPLADFANPEKVLDFLKDWSSNILADDQPVVKPINELPDSEELGKAIFEAIMGTTKPDWMVLVDKDGNPIPEDARWEDLPEDLRDTILQKMGSKPRE